MFTFLATLQKCRNAIGGGRVHPWIAILITDELTNVALQTFSGEPFQNIVPADRIALMRDATRSALGDIQISRDLIDRIESFRI